MHRTRDGEPRGETQAESLQNQENYFSSQLVGTSRVLRMHLTRDSESRGERQADSRQSQANYLSSQPQHEMRDKSSQTS